MQAVILAAGDGGRLLPLTEQRPKSLLEVGGKTLIQYVVEALLPADVHELIVVLGYRGDQIRERLEGRTRLPLRFVWNGDAESGNARSLLAALPLLRDGPFLLCMADHLFADGIGPLTFGLENGRDYLFVDRRRITDPEATRVRLDGEGRVAAIGKGLDEWNAVDAGIFVLHPRSLMHLAGLPGQAELNDAWQPLVARRQLYAIDIGDTWWTDIDTPADLAAADAAVRQRLVDAL